MNDLNRYGKQKGIGLLEVLITTLVMAVGLLAVASLQGKFMSSSGVSKTSAQAIKLAEAKTEEFRNNSTLAGFSAIASGTDSIAGSNATFTRTWAITNLTNVGGTIDPTRKRVAVNVTWPPATANESVNIVSQIAWLKPGNSTYYATAAKSAGVTARAPDPNQNSSTQGAAPGQPSSYSPGTGTGLGDGSNLSTHTDGAGNIVLLNAGGTVLTTFFGGRINTIKGTAYTVNLFSTNTLIVSVSESAGYCAFTNGATAHSTGEKRNYICYTGGNCKGTTPGSNGCPASPSAAQLAAYDKVGPGGWYGNIGPLRLNVASGDQEKVCFVPHVTGFAARLYSTLRTSSGVVTSEGINRSFACHDFLVVDQTGSDSDCATIISRFGILPEPQRITRTLTGDSTAAPNIVLAEDTTYCTVSASGTKTAVGGHTGDITSITLDGVACTGTYSCAISSDGTKNLVVTFTNPGTAANQNALCIGSTKYTASTATQSVANVTSATTLPTIKAISGTGTCP